MERFAFFTCRRCGIELTQLLRDVPEKALRWIVDEAILPEDEFTSMQRVLTYRQLHAQCNMAYSSVDGEAIVIDVGDFLMSPEAAIGTFCEGASHGCCGHQPRSESNFLCANGHPVATLHTDCWLPHIARLCGNSVDMHRV